MRDEGPVLTEAEKEIFHGNKEFNFFNYLSEKGNVILDS
jgi:hypothetical protein